VNIFPLYADERDNIEQDQKDDPAEYSSLSLLIPRLEAIEQSRHGTVAKPSQEDLREIWESEATVGVGAPVPRSKHTKTQK
jgi:hypothetical protein